MAFDVNNWSPAPLLLSAGAGGIGGGIAYVLADNSISAPATNRIRLGESVSEAAKKLDQETLRSSELAKDIQATRANLAGLNRDYTRAGDIQAKRLQGYIAKGEERLKRLETFESRSKEKVTSLTRRHENLQKAHAAAMGPSSLAERLSPRIHQMDLPQRAQLARRIGVGGGVLTAAGTLGAYLLAKRD